MSDRISNIDYSTFDFTNSDKISRSNIDQIMSQEKQRLTIDDSGNVIAITPPSKRDNFLIAFFKRNFGTAEATSEYRKQERLLNNMDKLAKNISFQNRIMTVLAEKFQENGFKESSAAVHLLKEELKEYIAEKKGKILTSINHTTTISYKQLVFSAVSRGSDKIDFKSNCGRDCVFLNGKSLNLFSFIKDNLPNGVKLPNDNIFDSDGINSSLLTAKIIKRCIDFPNDLSKMGLEEEANHLSGLCKHISIPDERDQSIIHDCVGNIMNTYKANLADIANKAIAGGKNPEEVASMLYGMLKETCVTAKHDKKSSTLFSRMFSQNNIDSKISKMPGNPVAVQNENDKLTQYYKCKNEDAIRAKAYLENNLIESKNFETFQSASMFCGTKKLLRGLFDSLNPVNGMGIMNTLNGIERVVKQYGDYSGIDSEKLTYEPSIPKMIALEAFLTSNDAEKELYNENMASMLELVNNAIDREYDLAKYRNGAVGEDYREPLLKNLNFLKNVLTESQEILKSQLPKMELAHSYSEIRSKAENFENLLYGYYMASSVSSPLIERSIDDKIEKFPLETRNFVKRYLTDKAKILSGANGSKFEEFRKEAIEVCVKNASSKVINDVIQGEINRVILNDIDKLIEKLSSQKYVHLFASQKTNSDEYNNGFINNALIDDSETSIVNMFLNQKDKHIDNNGFHNNFDRDVVGGVISRVAGHDISSVDDKVEQARKFASEAIPLEFRPFVTSAMMQGGATFAFTKMYNGDLAYRFNEKKELYSGGQIRSEGYLVKTYGYNDLELKKDETGKTSKIVINVHQDFGIDPIITNHSDLIPDYAGKKPVFVKELNFAIEIDLEKGVDENGVPKDMNAYFIGENTERPSNRFVKNFA